MWLIQCYFQNKTHVYSVQTKHQHSFYFDSIQLTRTQRRNMSFSSDEVNFLVYRYLQESGNYNAKHKIKHFHFKEICFCFCFWYSPIWLNHERNFVSLFPISKKKKRCEMCSKTKHNVLCIVHAYSCSLFPPTVHSLSLTTVSSAKHGQLYFFHTLGNWDSKGSPSFMRKTMWKKWKFQ